jgi:hypothetical protein
VYTNEKPKLKALTDLSSNPSGMVLKTGKQRSTK